MRYTILFKCLNDDKFSLEHNANEYEQAEHFFWAMVLKLKSAYDKIDTNNWELTLRINREDGNIDYKYHFSKT